MNHNKLFRPMIGPCLFLLLLPGCSAPATPSVSATLVPPTEMASLIPPTEMATLVPPAATATSAPPSNAVYFGTVEGKNIIFVTHDKEQALYEGYYSSYKNYGKVYCSGFDLNFNDLENPRFLFSIDNIENWISVICSDEMVYISGIRQEPDFGDISFVYVVNPKTGDFQEVWTGAPGYVDEITNNIIVIKLYPCYRCSPSPLRITVIVNADTGAEKELGEVGDVKILNGSVAYRYLAPLEVPCDPGEGCDGYYPDYEPAGKFILEPLP